MKIVLIVEGETERAFKPHLITFLTEKLAGRMPAIKINSHNGHIPTGDKLKRVVERLLNDSKEPADHVIALTDVYTGNMDFINAADAKNKMRQWVGDNNRFHPHVAQNDFEAWLLPYWEAIQELSKNKMSAPSGLPETVNHTKPPAYWVKEIFNRGNNRSYVKPRDADRILRGKDLSIAIHKCPELKAFINTILYVCGGTQIS
ncbi:MAG: DUF4276 family protein [Magnetococcus sp. YQC-5]